MNLHGFPGVVIAWWILLGFAAHAFLTWVFAVYIVKGFIFTVRAVREKRARDKAVSP